MTIRHLRIFLGVCAHGCNTTRAAEAMHMTQPAVSLAIRELEAHYDAALFDRIGRRLRLTGAGECLLGYARRVEALLDDMEKDVRGREGTGRLRVGASITIGAHFLPAYVKAYARLHPGAEVRATVAPQPFLESRLLDSALDVALMEGVPRNGALVSEEYMGDRLAVLCAPGRGGETPIEVFRGERFLLRERGSGTREEFDRATEGAGFRVEPMWESTDTAALVGAAAAGLGLAVLPRRMAVDALARGQVEEIRVPGLDLRRSYRIVLHKDKFLTPALKDFIEICRADGLRAP